MVQAALKAENLRAYIDTDTDNHVIEGKAIVFNSLSENMGFYEIITPEAVNDVDFSKTLLLYNHEFGDILARADSGNLDIQVKDDGVYFTATLANTRLAEDVYNDIKAGNIKGCSFSFSVAEGGDEWTTTDDGDQLRIVNNIDKIIELSLTPIPAYVETNCSAIRSLESKEEKGMEEEKKKEIKKDEEKVETPKDEVKEDTKKEEPKKDEVKKDVRSEEPKEEPKKEDLPKDEEGHVKAKLDLKSMMDELKGLVKEVKESKEKRENKPEEDKSETRNVIDAKDKGGADMAQVIKPKETSKDVELRNFHDYLENGSKYDTRAITGVGLTQGQVIIPKTILQPEHKVYQFPRLGSLVRTVSVKTTTGTLPLFNLVGDSLAEHTEFNETAENNAPVIQEIDWKLKSYTGKYVFSQELISDSAYDWQSELSSCLIELRDNTEDAGIMKALTTNPAHTEASSTDVVKDLKTALNVNLQPLDAANATIIASQSAFNYIDNLTDTLGRPLVNTNLTEGMGHQLLGHQLVVVPDTLFPSASQGDANFIVAPLNKAVINFKQSEITGQFQDTHDVWYKALGIFLREDIVGARPDLVSTIKAAPSVLAASTASTSSK